MSKDLVIVACGAKKTPRASRAAELYTGPYFRASLRYGLTLAKRDRVLILSAKYGLVGLDDELKPYDVALGDSGAIKPDQVFSQAQERGFAGKTFKELQPTVYVVGGERYCRLARDVWGGLVEEPLAHKGGMFQQIEWMNQQAENSKSALVNTVSRDAVGLRLMEFKGKQKQPFRRVTILYGSGPCIPEQHGAIVSRLSRTQAAHPGGFDLPPALNSTWRVEVTDGSGNALHTFAVSAKAWRDLYVRVGRPNVFDYNDTHETRTG